MSKTKDMIQKTEIPDWPGVTIKRSMSADPGNDMSGDSSEENETSKPLDNRREKEEAVDADSAGAPDDRARADDSASAKGDGEAPQIKNRLREFRIEQMMSKAELARKAGLSVLTIDRIEKGFGCRMDTKRKILKALGLKLSDRRKLFQEE
jgi:DNA-binding XRE family transcriptional regulator